MIDESTINLIPVVLFVMHVVIGTPGWPEFAERALRTRLRTHISFELDIWLMKRNDKEVIIKRAWSTFIVA